MATRGRRGKVKAAAAALLVLLLALAVATKGWLVTVPPNAEAGPGAFDADRAAGRLARILGDERPHPVDSAANDAVRARLIAELRAIGLAPRVADSIACNGSRNSRTISCARVRNVVVTFGPAGGRHVLMATHYDSSPAGPGAADPGIGMATMLETAALLRERRLARPVTLLFTEGEEVGLLGARAFLERDPLAPRVGALVNLEARGVTGPALMFETSRPNGPAIAAYRKVEHPAANSLTTDFYGLIPNSTDVAVFDERDWTILNFAIIGNETRYHSAGDDLAALDRRSLAHMGRQALAATEALATGAAAGSGGKLLYADLLGQTLVTLPLPVGLALLGLLLVLFVWIGWRRGGIGRGLATVALAAAGGAALGFLLQSLAGLVRAGEYWRAHPEILALALHLTTLLACAAAVLTVGRRLDARRLRAAFWLGFLLLGAALLVLAPGAAIFFLAPPIVAGAGMLVQRPRVEQAAALLAWALLYLSWAPLLALSETLLDLGAGWMFAPAAALLLLPVLIELRPLLARLPRRGALAGFAALAAIGWGAAALAPAYSADRKQAFGIEYIRGADGEARWMAATDGGPLPSAFGAFAPVEEVEWSGRHRLAAPAPALPVAAPSLDKIGEQATAEGRLVTFRLQTNGADTVLLRAEPEAQLRAAGIGGTLRRFGKGGAEADYFLRCVGRSCDGAEVRLLTARREPVEAKLVGIRTGLPAAARPLLQARPADAQPQYAPDSTIAVAEVRF